MTNYYAVAKGRNCGTFFTWSECENQVKGYKGAKFKKFSSQKEADEYIQEAEEEEENKEETKDENRAEEDEENTLYIYTDGSCRYNGTAKAICGIGLYIQENDKRNISRKLHVPKATNNVAELYAMIAAFELVEHEEKRVVIVSDSEYSIHCATNYGAKCAAKGWEVNIPNKELVKTLYEYHTSRPDVAFLHVKAHTGAKDRHSIGNSFADMFALTPLLDNTKIP